MPSLRSRNGCRNCKRLRIKCDENKPRCKNCVKRQVHLCDYSLVLKWEEMSYKTTKNPKRQSTCSQRGKNVTHNLFEITHKRLKDNNTHHYHTHEIIYNSDTLLSDKENEKEIKQKENNTLSEISYEQDIDTPNKETVQEDIPLDLLYIQLPSFLPTILTSSSYHMDLFDFYLQQTSHMLIPTETTPQLKNPFQLLLPQMAMQNETLLYLLMAFGANHKNNKLNLPSEKPLYERLPMKKQPSITGDPIFPNDQFLDDSWSQFRNPTITESLLIKTFQELSKSLNDHNQRITDDTLATILMLTMFDIFFSDQRRLWRKHLFGARNLINEKLKSLDFNSITIDVLYNEMDPRFFLNRWFAYVDIISSLSSVNQWSINSEFATFKYLSYEINRYENDPKLLYRKRVHLDDIEYCTGLDPKILLYLGKISTLINSSKGDETDETLIIKETENLDEELIDYLFSSELNRDEIWQEHYSTKRNQQDKENYQRYSLLRATNMIYGITGSLQLKRRLLNYPTSHPEVENLLRQVSVLVTENIPLCSSTTACIIFCLFCCGCDLFNNSLIELRDIYIERIVALSHTGVSSATMANQIMQQCWLLDKNWWEYLQEENLDITFAI